MRDASCPEATDVRGDGVVVLAVQQAGKWGKGHLIFSNQSSDSKRSVATAGSEPPLFCWLLVHMTR